jgi:hypothetical protein
VDKDDPSRFFFCVEVFRRPFLRICALLVDASFGAGLTIVGDILDVWLGVIAVVRGDGGEAGGERGRGTCFCRVEIMLVELLVGIDLGHKRFADGRALGTCSSFALSL